MDVNSSVGEETRSPTPNNFSKLPMEEEKEATNRLIISKMVLNNFKSYAGKQSIGPFHKSFSAVVGPNGSGKSNVIDSLLFVFGYRANKMRQSKLSELIHHSKNFPNLDSCFVEVHFVEIIDKGLETEYINGSELVIRRNAYKNNTSKYFINDTNSSFKEVTELLRNKGIDLDHNRFLILQGEVESISLMKPKSINDHDDGLLEYLEDIIGTSKYKSNIEEQFKKLELINEERQEKVNRLKIVEKEKNSLESKKVEAESYLKAENELIKKKNLVYQIKAYEADQKSLKALKKTDDLKQKLLNERKNYSEISSLNQELEQNLKKFDLEFEDIDQKFKLKNKELEKINREDIQFQENYKFLKNKLKKVKKQIEKDESKVLEHKSWIENHQNDFEKAKKEIELLDLKLINEEDKLGEMVTNLKGKTEGINKEIELKQKLLSPWIEKINAQQTLMELCQSKLNLLLSKKEAYDKQLEVYKKLVFDLNENKNSKIQQIEELKNDQLNIDGLIENDKNELNSLKLKERKFINDYQILNQKFIEAQNQNQFNKNKSKVLDSLMRQKELGKIRGIHGRLGSLGVIDPKFDVAISTACPQLEQIVVDTIETAQECIQYLRQNNIGRATFMALNSIPRNSMDTIKTPLNVPRLFDLVKPKDKIYTQAFYQVLRDTLVAENLDQAREVGMGKVRWRCVTLQGQTIEKAGTMSGGGNRVSKGSMSSHFLDEGVSAEALNELMKQSQKAELDLQQFKQDLKLKQAQLEKSERRKPEIDMQISKLNMDIQSLENQIQDGKKRHFQFGQNPSLSSKELLMIKEHKENIEQIRLELSQLQLSSKNIEDEIKVLNDKILQIGGVQLRQQNVKVSGIKEQIELLNQKMTKVQVTLNKTLKDIVIVENSISKGEEDMLLLDKDRLILKEKIENQTNLYQQCLEGVELLNLNKTDIETKLEQTKQKLDDIGETINQQKQLELELNNNIEDQTRILKEFKQKSQYWIKELKGLSLQPLLSNDNNNDDDDYMGDDNDNELVNQEELLTYQPEQLHDYDVKELEEFIQINEQKLNNQSPNLGVLIEYRKKLRDYLNRRNELESTTNQRDLLKDSYDELRQLRLTTFMEGFTTISYKLKEMYQMITLGGNAELELVDSLDPFSEGIIFSVMPPKKSWKNISNLSGGEKTLSSLALVFALHHFRPTPLYVMDEIDAALDFRNISIVANYIKERTQGAQFIIISLRNNMFELADRLVGIYKTHDRTKSITIDPNQISMKSMH